MLLPYRVHRAGPIGDAVDEAVAAADPGNPVTDVTVNGSVMTVTFADGSTVERQLPEGGDGGGVAQAVADAQAAQAVAETARAAAEAAETNAEAAEANAETAKANAETAQAGAVAARSGAETAETGAESARTGAQAARDGAQTAEGNAQTAQAAAEVARDGAVAAGGTDLFDATAAISNRTSLLTGNIVCPESGTLEFLFRQTVNGDRQGGVAYAHIPAATIRSMISAIGVAYSNDTSTLVILAHGANRGIGVGVTAANFYLVVNAQSAGTYAPSVGSMTVQLEGDTPVESRRATGFGGRRKFRKWLGVRLQGRITIGGTARDISPCGGLLDLLDDRRYGGSVRVA